MQQKQASWSIAKAGLLALGISLGLWALKAAASDEVLFSAVPINDLGTATYLGFEGGLYPGGTNVPPADHLTAKFPLIPTFSRGRFSRFPNDTGFARPPASGP